MICGITSAVMIFSAVMITCQMIWVRFVLNESTIWQTETVVYLMISATLIGLPYVQLVRGHVNVDLIPMMLTVKFQKVLAVCTLILTIAIVAIIAFFGFEFFYTAFEKNWKSDTVWGVRLWIPYLSLPVGFGLFLLQLSSDLYAVIIGEDPSFEHSVLEEDY
jgi:TRAP-type C4-dicarboxylate transport system permease small subunit